MLYKYSWMCGLPLECGQLIKDSALRKDSHPVPNTNTCHTKVESVPKSLFHDGIWADKSFVHDVIITVSSHV